MKVPFFDLSNHYNQDVRRKILTVVEKNLIKTDFIGGDHQNDFEDMFSEYLNVTHIIGCNSGTDALILALLALGIGAGDEVITTPFTFFATAEAISRVGGIPVFVDIDSSDYNIDVKKIKDAISERTKAILPVHIFGMPCDMENILDISKNYGLRTIEDAAQAIGSEFNGKKCGTIGDVGCFSFYPTKNLGGIGDGGMVVTNNDKVDACVRALHIHGSGKYGYEAYKGKFSDDQTLLDINPSKYDNFMIGFNSRLDTIQSEVLMIKLPLLDDYNKRRKAIADKYMGEITDRVGKPKIREGANPCWHQFAISTIYKYELSEYLNSKGIGTSLFYPIPLHKQKAYTNSNSRVSGDGLPVAELLSSQTLCLPIYPELEDEQVDYVIENINAFFKER